MNLTCLKSGIWQAELRVPEDLRDVIGKTRFAKSMRTRNKREAVVKAAPILEQWQSEIDLAKTDPQAFSAKQILHNERCDFGENRRSLEHLTVTLRGFMNCRHQRPQLTRR